MPTSAQIAAYSDMFADGLAARLPANAAAARLGSVVRALHAAVADLQPTVAELRSVIEFLTEVGQASDHRRQEMALLSDVLGLTSAVEAINARRPAGATPNAPRGPFYRPDAPHLALGASISIDGIGERLNVSGAVKDLDGNPVAGAVVETWQANAQGIYENQLPDAQPEFNLRGVFIADEDGRFRYATVKPAGYDVPGDGPAGRLLQSFGVPLRRPAHLHFQVSSPGFETLTTQIFDQADGALSRDPVFAVRPELLGAVKQAKAKGGGREWSLEVAVVLVRARPARSRA